MGNIFINKQQQQQQQAFQKRFCVNSILLQFGSDQYHNPRERIVNAYDESTERNVILPYHSLAGCLSIPGFPPEEVDSPVFCDTLFAHFRKQIVEDVTYFIACHPDRDMNHLKILYGDLETVMTPETTTIGISVGQYQVPQQESRSPLSFTLIDVWKVEIHISIDFTRALGRSRRLHPILVRFLPLMGGFHHVIHRFTKTTNRRFGKPDRHYITNMDEVGQVIWGTSGNHHHRFVIDQAQ